MSGHTGQSWRAYKTQSGVWYVAAGELEVFIAELTKNDNSEANAKLMAAAPELLDALEFVLHDWQQGWKAHDTASYQMALDAIKKARGQ